MRRGGENALTRPRLVFPLRGHNIGYSGAALPDVRNVAATVPWVERFHPFRTALLICRLTCHNRTASVAVGSSSGRGTVYGAALQAPVAVAVAVTVTISDSSCTARVNTSLFMPRPL